MRIVAISALLTLSISLIVRFSVPFFQKWPDWMTIIGVSIVPGYLLAKVFIYMNALEDKK